MCSLTRPTHTQTHPPPPVLQGNAPRQLGGKTVLQVYLLGADGRCRVVGSTALPVPPARSPPHPPPPPPPDNSYKTLLTEPKATVLDTCKSLAEKLGFSDPEDDALCFSLNECLDGVTSA